MSMRLIIYLIRQLQGLPYTIGLLTPAEAIVAMTLSGNNKNNRTQKKMIFWIYADKKKKTRLVIYLAIASFC